MVDQEFRTVPQKQEQKVAVKDDKVAEDLKEAEDIAEKEAERLSPSMAQKDDSE